MMAPTRVASLWLRLAGKPKYEDYVEKKKRQHEDPLSKEDWEARVDGGGEEDTGQRERAQAVGQKIVTNIKRPTGWRDPKDEQSLTAETRENWEKEHTARTAKGSVVLGVTHMDAEDEDSGAKSHSDATESASFKEHVLKEVDKAVKAAIEAGKKVVFLGEGGKTSSQPYDDETLDDPNDWNEQHAVAKAVREATGGKAEQGTWDDGPVDITNPDAEVWGRLTKAAGGNEVKAKGALAVFLAGQGDTYEGMKEQGWMNDEVADEVERATGIDIRKDVSKDDEAKMFRMAFPGDTGEPHNEVSAIGEVYNAARQENLLKKIKALEAKGKVVIVAPGAGHAYQLKHVLEGSKLKGKTATTPSDVHDLADDLDIPWDDDPDFMAFCEQVVGETHLDDMSPEELGEVADALKRSKEAGDSGPRYKEKKEVPKADGSGKTTVYVYSERQVQNRNREKAERVEKLRHSIEDLREQVGKDVDSDDPKKRLTALAVALIDATFERVGNESSADEGHFGVTGWLKKHVTFGKGKATVKYVGKSGVDHEKVVTEKWLVDALRDCCADKKPDEALLSFGKDDADGPVRVTSRDVNAYLEPFEVTAKDLRGYHANTQMQENLRAVRKRGPKLPRDRKEKDKVLKAEFKEALEKTAEAVGHEASTLKSQYLVPGLEDQYIKDGTVEDTLKKAGSGQLWYHLTDRAKFKLDPKFTPADNALAIEDRSGQAGIYLGADVERWVHGYGYWRPFVVEVRVDPSVKDDPGVGGRWGGELFVPATSFDKVEVVRVIPIDAWAREQYNDYGWVESALGRTFDTGEPIVEPGWNQPRKRPFPGGYRYPGPDVREMPASESSRLRKDLRGAKGRLASTGRVASHWLRTAIIHVDNATDGEEGTDLWGFHGLVSSLTLYERAVVEDLDIHPEAQIIRVDAEVQQVGRRHPPGTYLLRGHAVDEGAVKELEAAGYLVESEPRVFTLSPMFEAKRRLYTASARVASAWMKSAATRYEPIKVVRARDYPMPEKPTRVWEWSLGQAPPSSLSRPRYGNSLPADEGHDWKWRAGVFRYSGTGGRGEAWLILQFGPDAQGEEKVCSSCGVSMPDHARFCPSCGMAQKVATKTPGEREDEEAERLVRPSPKLKPPRDDRKREKMQVESDPDLKGSDKDLSLNYKDVGG